MNELSPAVSALIAAAKDGIARGQDVVVTAPGFRKVAVRAVEFFGEGGHLLRLVGKYGSVEDAVFFIPAAAVQAVMVREPVE